MGSDPDRAVRRRHVFYLPGYDPIPPRRYREIYRREAAKQAKISGYTIDLKPKKGKGRYGWTVSAQIEGAPVTADVEVLLWSDIVRDSMAEGVVATYLQLLRTAWVYIASGALFRLMRLRKGPVIAALYPVGFLLAQLAIALLLAWGLGRICALLHPWLAWAGLLAVPVVLGWFRRHDNRFYAYYLMHDYAFSARYGGADPPALRARIREFTGEIAAALRLPVDEVLVVGHSSGAHLAVSALAALIRQGDVPRDGPALSFLSLGQVIPMVSFLPAAHQLRADLACLSASDALTWVDISAPGDGAAFALCDPVAVSGVAPERKRWPLVLSAAFSQTLSPARWRALRWRFFDLHFQYLFAFDRPREYDYFRVTAGPMTLAARFAGCPPSPSRIERACSGFTSVAP